LARLRVLIADDNKDFRDILVRILTGSFEVLGVAADGFELVKAATVLRPDVIVSDIQMPKLSGPEAMQELNTRGLAIPFVFISACKNLINSSAAFVLKDDILQLPLAIRQAAASQSKLFSS
jgi:CheY-like chemotaxis protein